MTDQIGPDVELSQVAHLPVLGVMTTFATNSAAAMDAIRALYGSWTTLDEAVVSPSNAIVKIVVRDDIAAPSPGRPLRYHVPHPARLKVESSDAHGVADTARLESLAFVNTSMVARSSEFGEGVVEPLTVFLLGALDREPLHAAGIVRDGVAILLAGPSGTGKSTLAFAACRDGYSLLADEPVYVQTRPVLRVWGRRARIHLQADARAHFPELRDRVPTRLPTGKDKIVLDLPNSARYADRVGICVVGRAAGEKAQLKRLSPEQVVTELGTTFEPGYDLFAHTMRERLTSIAECGAWHLQVGSTPGAAVRLLDTAVAELVGRA